MGRRRRIIVDRKPAYKERDVISSEIGRGGL